MPEAGGIGEAVAKNWLLRERFLAGFSVWQQVLSFALGRTDAFLLVSNSIGELISNIHLTRPLALTDAWQDKFDELLDAGRFELDKETARANAAADPNNKEMIIAEKALDPEKAMRDVEAWSKLHDDLVNSQS